MKKLLAILMCVMVLSACSGDLDLINPTPTPSAGTNDTQTLRTMIASTNSNPIKKDWTVLGEVGYIIDGEYCDIQLATDAEKDSNGEVAWDDSQNWALVVAGESRNFVLYKERLNGMAYMNVTTVENLPVITLVCDTPAGIKVIKYVYSEDAFYEEELVSPENGGNNIFSSFPEYND